MASFVVAGVTAMMVGGACRDQSYAADDPRFQVLLESSVDLTACMWLFPFALIRIKEINLYCVCFRLLEMSVEFFLPSFSMNMPVESI